MTVDERERVRRLEQEIEALYHAMYQQRQEFLQQKQTFVDEFVKFRDEQERRLHSLQKYYCYQFIRFFDNAAQQNEQKLHINEQFEKAERNYQQSSEIRQKLHQLSLQNDELQQMLLDANKKTMSQAAFLKEKEKIIINLELQAEFYQQQGGVLKKNETIASKAYLDKYQPHTSDSSLYSASRSQSREKHGLKSHHTGSRVQLRNEFLTNLTDSQQGLRRHPSFIQSVHRNIEGSHKKRVQMTTAMCGDECDHQNIKIIMLEDENIVKLTKNSTIEVPQERSYTIVANRSLPPWQQHRNAQMSFQNLIPLGANFSNRTASMFNLSNSDLSIQEINDDEGEVVLPQQQGQQLARFKHSRDEVQRNIEISTDDDLYVATILPWIIDLEQSKVLLVRRYCQLEETNKQQQAEIRQCIREKLELQDRICLQEQQCKRQIVDSQIAISQLRADLDSQVQNYKQLGLENNELRDMLSTRNQAMDEDSVAVLQLQTQLRVQTQQIQHLKGQLDKMTSDMAGAVGHSGPLQGHCDTKLHKEAEQAFVEQGILNAQIERDRAVIQIQQLEIDSLCSRIKSLQFENQELQVEMRRRFAAGHTTYRQNSDAVGALQQQLDFAISQVEKCLEEIGTKNAQLETLETQLSSVNIASNLQQQNITVMRRRLLQMDDLLRSNERKITEYIRQAQGIVDNCYAAFLERDARISHLEGDNERLHQQLAGRNRLLKRGLKGAEGLHSPESPQYALPQVPSYEPNQQDSKYQMQLGASRPEPVTVGNVWSQIIHASSCQAYDANKLMRDKQRLDNVVESVVPQGGGKLGEFLDMVKKNQLACSVENKRVQTDSLEEKPTFVNNYCQTESMGVESQVQTYETLYTAGKRLQQLVSENQYLQQQLEIYRESKIISDVLQLKTYREFRQEEAQNNELLAMLREDVFSHRMREHKLHCAIACHKCPTFEHFQSDVQKVVSRELEQQAELHGAVVKELRGEITSRDLQLRRWQDLIAGMARRLHTTITDRGHAAIRAVFYRNQEQFKRINTGLCGIEAAVSKLQTRLSSMAAPAPPGAGMYECNVQGVDDMEMMVVEETSASHEDKHSTDAMLTHVEMQDVSSKSIALQHSEQAIVEVQQCDSDKECSATIQESSVVVPEQTPVTLHPTEIQQHSADTTSQRITKGIVPQKEPARSSQPIQTPTRRSKDPAPTQHARTFECGVQCDLLCQNAVTALQNQLIQLQQENNQQLQNKQEQIEECLRRMASYERELDDLTEFRTKHTEYVRNKRELAQLNDVVRQNRQQISDLENQILEMQEYFRTAEGSLALMLGDGHDVISEARRKKWRIGAGSALQGRRYK